MGFYTDVIQDLSWVMYQIQMNGLLIDRGHMLALHKKAGEELEKIKTSLEEALSYPYNPNSTQQTMWMFSEDLRIPLRDGSNRLTLLKTQAKNPDVTPLVQSIDLYRRFSKARGTYLGLQPNPDGRIRSTLYLNGTLTWRLASKRPNLQNIPRPGTFPVEVKDIYCAPAGRVFVEFDYKNLEARIPAYASRCQKLIDIFEQNRDLYCEVARTILGRPVTKENKRERFTGKTYRLAGNFGAGARKKVDIILLQSGQYIAEALIKRWDLAVAKEWPEPLVWQEQCHQIALKHGYVEDGFGVRRYLYGRKEDYRQIAISDPTQRTASGIMNRGMVRIFHYYDRDLTHPDHKLCMQIHDALLFEVPEGYIDQLIAEVKPLMEHPVTIFEREVVFPVDVKVGKQWGSLQNYES